jgi:hypothetical protein
MKNLIPAFRTLLLWSPKLRTKVCNELCARVLTMARIHNAGVGGVYDREIVSMNDLKRMLLLKGLQLRDLTIDVESGTADGYISIPGETSFIGDHGRVSAA